MRVYVAYGTAGYELCHPVDEEMFPKLYHLLDGTSRKGAWRPPEMRLIRKVGSRVLRPSDSPWFGVNALIFRESVVSSLASFLEGAGELLPIVCPGESLYFLNPPLVEGVLDLESSVVERLSTGTVMAVLDYVLLPGLVRGHTVFKSSGIGVSPSFLSGDFVDDWKARGLRGLDFVEVWRDEYE